MRFLARWKENIDLTPWFRRGLDLLFPPQCSFCQEELSDQERTAIPLCESCQKKFLPSGSRFCRRCGTFRAIAEPEPQPAPGISSAPLKSCPHCRRESFLFSQVVVLGIYDGDLREAVLRMKRDRIGDLTAATTSLFFRERETELRAIGADWIMPIPMHFLRRWIRGINAPERIARGLGELLRIPNRPNWIRRTRRTVPQSQLNPKERLQNVKDAFAFRKRIRMFDPKRTLRDKKVLLVDDILTTGSTCEEIARLLLDAGAKSVALAVFARASGLSKTDGDHDFRTPGDF